MPKVKVIWSRNGVLTEEEIDVDNVQDVESFVEKMIEEIASELNFGS